VGRSPNKLISHHTDLAAKPFSNVAFITPEAEGVNAGALAAVVMVSALSNVHARRPTTISSFVRTPHA
jgi:hypothetical protein